DAPVPPLRAGARVPVHGDPRRPRPARPGPDPAAAPDDHRDHRHPDPRARAAHPDPHRARPPPLLPRRADPAGRAVRRPGALGPHAQPDAAGDDLRRHHVVHRRPRARARGAVDLRHRGRRDPVLPRPRRGRRGPAAPALQRHGVLRLRRRRGRGAGRPGPVELGDRVPAPGRRVVADDGRSVRRHRVAPAARGHPGPVGGLARGAGPADLGADLRRAARRGRGDVVV
ncbi:MAG: Uncharacterized protein MSMEG_2716, partial [uncultured Actinomycetospora sp.]